MTLAATEILVLLVVWLAGRLWRLEGHNARIRWLVANSLVAGFTFAWVATNPAGADGPAMELICGGAIGLLIMMTSRLERITG